MPAEDSSDGGASTSLGSVPNQLAMLVPTFNPATDSVDTWTQKVEMLVLAWPETKIKELATRLVLGCQGTAFQKLQLHRSEVLTNDPKCIQKIVEIVGGIWGQVPLEQKFELAERALYRTQQKNDETSDSYLARMDVTWTELLSKKLSLSELQAYVTLRSSRLSPEDKKRVIVESGAESGGQLELRKVSAAIRMLGSSFFQDVTGQRRDKSQKVYDHLTLAAEECEESEMDAYYGQDETWDDEAIEALAAENDEDASMILQFEDAVAEVVQGDHDLAAFFSTYQDARRRLSERVRVRGFWPVKKGMGKKGTWKGKGPNKGKGSSLAQRIANSHCRLCNQKGHWKAECPNRASNPSGSSSATVVPTSFAIVDPVLNTVIEVPVMDQPIPNAADPHARTCVQECHVNFTDNLGHNGDNKISRGKNMSKFWAVRFGSKLRHRLTATSDSIRRSAVPAMSLPKVPESPNQVLRHDHVMPEEISQDSRTDVACFASSGTVGIVDLGASRTVVGSQQVKEILNGVPEHIRSRIRRTSCNLVFRFGNHQTLSSQHALLFPFHDMWFEVAIVEGNTPFLLSASFLKQIGAVIDVEHNQLWSRVLNRALPVGTSPRNLMLLDINELWETENQTHAGLVMEAQFQENAETNISLQVSSKNEHWRRSVDSVLHQPSDHTSPRESPAGCPQSAATSETSQPITVSRPKSVEPQLLCDLSQDTGVFQDGHLSSKDEGSSPESQHRNRNAEPRVIPEDVTFRDETTDSGFRREVPRPKLPDSLSGQSVGRVVCKHVLQEHQDQSPEVLDVCGEATGGRGMSVSGQTISQSRQSDTGKDQAVSEASHRPRPDRVGQCIGGEHAQQPCARPLGTDVQHAGQSSQHASEDVWDRERRARADHSHQGPPGEDRDVRVLRDHEATSLHAVDWAKSQFFDLPDPAEVEFEFHANTHPMSFSQEFQRWIKVFEKEVNMLRRLNFDSIRISRLDVLEVMCSEDSELTKQVHHLNGKAQRFGIKEGDLQQTSARLQLFRLILLRRPKSLWYSPECGPWSMWNFLNMGKSLELEEKLIHKRFQHVWQIALGVVLYRLQVSQGNHFHWEQPGGSDMFKFPELDEVHHGCHLCRFDLCRVGNLQDPRSHAPIR